MLTTIEEAYILGLWCADGYHRTSSIGLSNTDIDLVKKFSYYLLRRFPNERLRLRIYVPVSRKKIDMERIDILCKKSCLKAKKAKQISYHIYVNSRSLLREFREKRLRLACIKKQFILPYIAGRFDGDGSIGNDLKRDFRIVYAKRSEAECDKALLKRVCSYQTRVYHYKKANIYALYIFRIDSHKLVEDLLSYSLKLQKIVDLPRRD